MSIQKTLALGVFSFILSLPVLCQTREVLSNAQIIEMVQNGWGESLIVAKVNKSECKCDTSTAGISKLKNAKVSDAIIMAMIDAAPGGYSESKTTARKEEPTQSSGNITPTETANDKIIKSITEPGIYLFENGKMNPIEPSVFSGSGTNMLKSSLTFGIKKAKYKAKVRGKSANLQVGSGMPTFYFVFGQEYRNSGAAMSGFWGYASSPAEFLLAQMDIQSNSRQIVMGEVRAFTGDVDMGARDKDVREYQFEKIKTGVYKVSPKQNLLPGEYAFYYAGTISGFGFAGGKVFDFSVR